VSNALDYIPSSVFIKLWIFSSKCLQ